MLVYWRTTPAQDAGIPNGGATGSDQAARFVFGKRFSQGVAAALTVLI